MEHSSPQKKGLGPLAWIGIGCGSLVVLAIIGFVVFGMMFGGKIKEFAEEASKNPTRMTATTMVKMSAGQFEMVAEDDVNKRYTVKEKSGKLTTIYWNEAAKKPEVIAGDFSAIPNSSNAPNSSPSTVPSESSAPATPIPSASGGTPN